MRFIFRPFNNLGRSWDAAAKFLLIEMLNGANGNFSNDKVKIEGSL